VNRRRLLAVLGAAATGGLAGCNEAVDGGATTTDAPGGTTTAGRTTAGDPTDGAGDGTVTVGDTDWTPPEYVDRAAFTEFERTVDSACGLDARLSLPTGSDPVDAVVLVHGSGPQGMDVTVGPNKIFRDLAWGLATQGIAAFRYDKRTQACATNSATATLDTVTIDDAVQALSQVAAEDRVRNVVVAGHSMGGAAAPRIAREFGDAAGVAMLAANARPLYELVPEQVRFQQRLDGELTDRENRTAEAVNETVDRIASGDIPDDFTFAGAGAPFWRSIRNYDRVETAKRLSVPFFVAQGERDFQVSVERDFRRWQDALGDREDATFALYPQLNHFLMPGEGPPSPDEYRAENHVAVDVVVQLAAFVADAA
jgi:alpha-beta hydrolase superfamily lysophospholipase